MIRDPSVREPTDPDAPIRVVDPRRSISRDDVVRLVTGMRTRGTLLVGERPEIEEPRPVDRCEEPLDLAESHRTDPDRLAALLPRAPLPSRSTPDRREGTVDVERGVSVREDASSPGADLRAARHPVPGS